MQDIPLDPVGEFRRQSLERLDQIEAAVRTLVSELSNELAPKKGGEIVRTWERGMLDIIKRWRNWISEMEKIYTDGVEKLGSFLSLPHPEAPSRVESQIKKLHQVWQEDRIKIEGTCLPMVSTLLQLMEYLLQMFQQLPHADN